MQRRSRVCWLRSATSADPAGQQHRDDDHEESNDGQDSRNGSAVRVQSEMRVCVPGFGGGREHGAGKGDRQRDAGRRSLDLPQECPGRRDEHARGADVEWKMSRMSEAQIHLRANRSCMITSAVWLVIPVEFRLKSGF